LSSSIDRFVWQRKLTAHLLVEDEDHTVSEVAQAEGEDVIVPQCDR